MQDNQQITTKRSEFRTHIRRKQIQQHFYQQRLKFAEGQIREEQDQIMKELDTPERKKQWVYKKAAQLGHTPQGNWHQIFRTLSIGTRAFSEGDFIDWIQSGITQCLVLVLKQEYLELELSKMSASILQDIFYYLPAQSALIQNLLQHEFILDLVELCANTQSSAQYYYQLIIVMLQNRVYIRNLFIDNGIVQILCTQLKNYLQKNMDIDSDQVYCALSLAYRLVKVYQVKGGKSLPKGNVVSVLIPILDGYLKVIKREESLRVVLKSFASLGMSQKQYIFAYMFESPNLISFLLHALEKQSSNQNRAIAASTLASILSSQKISYSEQLLRRDILDKVLACSRMENNNRQCIDSLLRIISNTSVNSLQDARKVVAHQVFGELIISHANQTQNQVRIPVTQKTHQTSIYIICSLLHYENLQLTETLLKKYNILQSLIQGLRAQILSIPNCLEIIRSLIILVRMYNRIYTGSQNKIVLQLERLYNINNVLAIVEERVRNQRVLGLVRLLFQVMNGEG